MGKVNFDAMPDTKPSGAKIAKGQYKAHIDSATMTQGQDLSKPQYILMVLTITDPQTNVVLGKVWDGLYESTSEFIQYKTKRIAVACGLKLSGDVEFSDIAHLIAGNDILVDITIDKNDDTKSIVDIFSADIYYPLDGKKEEITFESEDDTPFTVEDTAGSQNY